MCSRYSVLLKISQYLTCGICHVSPTWNLMVFILAACSHPAEEWIFEHMDFVHVRSTCPSNYLATIYRPCLRGWLTTTHLKIISSINQGWWYYQRPPKTFIQAVCKKLPKQYPPPQNNLGNINAPVVVLVFPKGIPWKFNYFEVVGTEWNHPALILNSSDVIILRWW